ncbi:hypothetical protein EBZ80_25505 [bacterium]|nr:hypothetical protein [bacterium]
MLWSAENTETPRQVFKSSHEKYMFDCDRCFETFLSRPSNINQGTWCPYCLRKTEKKLLDRLRSVFPDAQAQFRPEWCWNHLTGRCLPFDFVVLSDQHFIIIH